MTDLKKNFEKFEKEWHSKDNEKKFRHAIESNRKICLKSLRQMRILLQGWFGEQLYLYGMVPKKIISLVQEFDFGFKVGAGFSVDAVKKHKFNISRYILHLLIINDSQERRIKSLVREISLEQDEFKENLLKMEDFIISLHKRTEDADLADEIGQKFWHLISTR